MGRNAKLARHPVDSRAAPISVRPVGHRAGRPAGVLCFPLESLRRWGTDSHRSPCVSRQFRFSERPRRLRTVESSTTTC
ncbi:MAG: hypothetical protein H6Q05_2980 [Acidobacteria bacterium]|nr:hypothetical protein [Acidobacteriota bacterium]